MSATRQPTRRLLTVEDYFRMGEVGILAPDERVELIDGQIITMAPIGSPHASYVSRLIHLLGQAVGNSAVLWTQCPIRISDLSVPEPDFALLAPREDFYHDSLPKPSDTYLVIEVAHSSLAYDRDRKAPLYAVAGILEFWLIDVEGGSLIRYWMPTESGYAECETIDTSVPIQLPTIGCEVDLSSIFC